MKRSRQEKGKKKGSMLRLSPTDDPNRDPNSKWVFRDTVPHEILLQPMTQIMMLK
jgi:hypothetical protein